MRQIIGSILLLLVSIQSNGFELTASSWQFPSATFNIGIPGNSPSGESWNSAFKRAMNEWTTNTVFEFIAVDQTLDPCIDRTETTFGDGITGVGFSATQCSSAFGSSVLAVTLKTLNCANNACTGEREITDADIVFNESANWDIYGGNLRAGVRDFHRVALHELGHALGLDHEPNETAIMQPLVSNISSLQEDDIQGANFIYSGESIISSIYGIDIVLPLNNELSNSNASLNINGTLSQSDSKLNSRPIDIYQIRLANSYDIDVRLSSSNLNSLLYLVRVDSSQSVIPEFSFINDNFGFGQNARINASLEEGTYWIGATSGGNFDFGDYTLTLNADLSASQLNGIRSFDSIYGATVQINPNPVIEGSLSNSDFTLDNRFLDIYQITLDVESSLRFDLESNEIDTKLLLVEIEDDQSIGTIALENDDNGFGTNSRVESNLPAGTYWIGVTSFNPNETGNYRIDTTVVVP